MKWNEIVFKLNVFLFYYKCLNVELQFNYKPPQLIYEELHLQILQVVVKVFDETRVEYLQTAKLLKLPKHNPQAHPHIKE